MKKKPEKHKKGVKKVKLELIYSFSYSMCLLRKIEDIERTFCN